MDMKRDYFEDIELFSSGTVLFWSGVFLIFLFTLPLYIPSYNIYLFNIIMVHVILAVGLNILVGYTGQISLGHAGFFAIGAYGTALLMMHLHLPFLVALILAGLLAAFFGFIIGLPALRLEGPYLAIATLRLRAHHHAHHRQVGDLRRPHGHQHAAVGPGSSGVRIQPGHRG